MFFFLFVALAWQGECEGFAAPKVINGDIINIEEAPYYVTVYPTGCGGVIISETKVLTAAHCFKKVQPTGVGVGMSVEGSGELIPLQQNGVRTHPYYDNNTDKNDIAVLTLEKPLRFNKFVNKLNLPLRDFSNSEGLSATVVGFGIFDNSLTSSQYLRRGTVAITDKNRCKSYEKFDSLTMICVYPVNGQLSNPGDSGGPLAMGNTLIGLVSFGLDTTEPHPTVYTNVYKFLSFIRQ